MMKTIIAGSVALTLASACALADVNPATPQFAPVPAPTAAETSTVMPAVVLPPANARANTAVQTKLRSLAKGWVLPVGSGFTQVQANALAKRLQSLGFSAFVDSPDDQGVYQVFVGPEVDLGHLQSVRKRLITATPETIGTAEPYIVQR